MNYLIRILFVLAGLLLVFNFTQIDYSQLFNTVNTVPMIAILACLCVLVLLSILLVSKKIERLRKRK